MEGSILSICIIAAIALAVFLGYKTKINTGFFCIVFAYIIGCFVMGLKPKALIAYWPTNTMFVILAVSLFYNVAAANGTLEKISRSLLYACRKFPGLLPYALFFVAVILSVMGAAYFTVLAFLAPITLLICEEARMDKLTGAVAINCGALAGGNFPTAALGVIFRGLMDTAYEGAPELTPIDSFSASLTMFALAIVSSLIIITVFRFCFKSNRNIGKGVKFEKPAAYDKKQKQTLTLILVMMAVVLIFPVLKLILPGNKIISTVAGKIDVGLVAIVFAVIALLLRLPGGYPRLHQAQSGASGHPQCQIPHSEPDPRGAAAGLSGQYVLGGAGAAGPVRQPHLPHYRKNQAHHHSPRGCRRSCTSGNQSAVLYQPCPGGAGEAERPVHRPQRRPRHPGVLPAGDPAGDPCPAEKVPGQSS